MSRIGKKIISIPNGVTVTVDGNIANVKGSKGQMSLTLTPHVTVEVAENQVTVKRVEDNKQGRSLHGLTRNLIQNMILGVSQGFVKRLEINGVGYRFQIQGKKLVLSLGYSHPIEYVPGEGIEMKADEEKKNVLVLSGIDKQRVGQVAAEIRGFRKPEPYKGKGIRYENEYVRRKAGKSVAKGA